MSKRFVIVQRVWSQVSSDYQAAVSTRTLVVTPETTVAEIMAWAKKPYCLAKGDIVLCEEDA